jgi:hypothetical protein
MRDRLTDSRSSPPSSARATTTIEPEQEIVPIMASILDSDYVYDDPEERLRVYFEELTCARQRDDAAGMKLSPIPN